MFFAKVEVDTEDAIFVATGEETSRKYHQSGTGQCVALPESIFTC